MIRVAIVLLALAAGMASAAEPPRKAPAKSNNQKIKQSNNSSPKVPAKSNNQTIKQSNNSPVPATTPCEAALAAALGRFSAKDLKYAHAFFAPVVKKWLPTGERFVAEYTVTTNKSAVISKYLPKARAAIDDARRMKIPAKAEPERMRYVNAAEALYSTLLLYTSLSSNTGFQ